jgi:hypothetical protein
MKSASKIQKWGEDVFVPAILFSFFALVFVTGSALADVGPAGVAQSRVSEPVSEPVSEEGDKEDAGAQTAAWFDVNELRQNLTYDKIKIRPRYRQEYEFDRNILREPGNDEKSDSIFREIPGVQVVIPFQDHYVKADYEARLSQFVKFPADIAEDQYFNVEGGLNFTDMYLRATESLSHTSDRSGTTFTERVPRFENKVDVTGGYQANRFLGEAGYTNFVRNYNRTSDGSLDYHYNQFHTRGYMDVTEKTKLLVDYVLTGYEYPSDSSRDGTSNQISAGFKSRLLPKTSFFSKFGYEHVGYDSVSDANNFIAEVGVHYDPFAKTVVDLGWVRSTQQATFAGQNDFTQDELFLKLKQHVTQKLSGEGYLAYTNQDYRNSSRAGTAGLFRGERDDDLLTMDLKLLYAFTDWLSGDIRYQYNRRDSNASTFDYTDHLMTVGVSLKS